MIDLRAAPFTLQSIAFAFPGTREAIPLRDPTTLLFLGDEPEWTRDGRSVAAAFVCRARPRVRVVFSRPQGPPGPSGTWRIRAAGSGGPGLEERELDLAFDQNGLSGPHEFQLDVPLPDTIGRLMPEWTWRAEDATGTHALGVTRHLWYLAWRTPVPPTDWASLLEPRNGPVGGPDTPWTYSPLMDWTCGWAAEKNDEKAICDAILAGLPESGLRYAVGAWNVHDMLVKRGGYCGGWYRMLQAMAGAHGVRLERRQFSVDWREEPEEQARWCAIVVESPGLNRRQPAEAPSTFHDVKDRPIPTSPVEVERERRYRFWGLPRKILDGHSINFLSYQGGWYLYDACFFDRAIPLKEFGLPVSDRQRPVPVEALGDFKEAYLDQAVRFMLGSLLHHGELYETVHPDPQEPGFAGATTRNGLTVETALIPNRDATITFYWNE